MLTFWEAMEQVAMLDQLSVSWMVLEDSSRPIVPIVCRLTVRALLCSTRRRAAAGTGMPAKGNAATAASSKVAQHPAMPRTMGRAATIRNVGNQDDETEQEGDSLGRFLDHFEHKLLEPMAPPDDDDGGQPPRASSSAAAPAAPAPPVPEAASSRAPAQPAPKRRGRGEATVVFPWGKLAYFTSKGALEAVCRNPTHGNCVLTRSGASRAGTEGADRP